MFLPWYFYLALLPVSIWCPFWMFSWEFVPYFYWVQDKKNKVWSLNKSCWVHCINYICFNFGNYWFGLDIPIFGLFMNLSTTLSLWGLPIMSLVFFSWLESCQQILYTCFQLLWFGLHVHFFCFVFNISFMVGNDGSRLSL